MSLSKLFGVGVSGLMASQRGLANAGHNIANVNTPGYSRQRVDLVAKPAQGAGNGFIGKGVDVNSVRRSYDQFLTTQLRTSTSSHTYSEAFYALAARVDGLLAAPASGLSSALQNFFAALHDLAEDPASLPARQLVLSEGEGLVQRFHTLDSQLAELGQAADERLSGLVQEVDGLANAVADLNRGIIEAEGATGGQPANDLRDRRDELVRQLAERIGITTLEQDDGALNITIGNGQALVTGSHVASLTSVPNAFDPNRHEIAITTGEARAVISDALRGGEIGAVLEFRSQVLDPAQNAVGRVAIALAETFNGQHRQGVDLAGNPGEAFFAPLESRSAHGVHSHQLNSPGGAAPGVVVTDPHKLSPSDYLLDYDGTRYRLTRISDNSVEVFDAPLGSIELPQDGLRIDVSGLTAGDRFLLQPTHRAARDIQLAITDERAIAAGHSGSVGDNRNALALAALQTTPTLANQSATYEEAYGQLVVSVGATTRRAETQRGAQEILLQQVMEAREQVAGVNLDEEAANLLRYQQAYQASARFIAVADEVLSSLLAAVGR
ncbi:MAG: flagellar hook-associated protein FlgK [Gammaproteobacteria bacterium]